MIRTKLIAAAALALGTAAVLPATASAQVGWSITVGNAPPAPLYERIPAPRRGYVWAPGYWRWNGHRHVWNGGHWERERAGYAYQPAEWVRVGNGWRLREGSWVTYQARNDDYRYRHHHYRDRRYDRDRDGIPDRYDRDRDGDGVPNRYDSRPDNPRRH